MTLHSFELQIQGVDHESFGDFSELLYSRCNDVTAAFQRGVATVAFDREATTLREAIASAINDIHRAAPAVTVVGILMDDGQPIDGLFTTVSASSPV